MNDAFQIVPLRNFGDDETLEDIRSRLGAVRRDAESIKNKEIQAKALEALNMFELWYALALREEWSK